MKGKVKQIAVENFLGSLDKTIPLWQQLANLSLDAMLYRWNGETVRAIRKGIQQAYKKC
jgi:hypothetical protein